MHDGDAIVSPLALLRISHQLLNIWHNCTGYIFTVIQPQMHSQQINDSDAFPI